MKFEEFVEEVIKEYRNKSVQDRNEIVEKITEEYVMKYGRKPDSYQLTKLANLILMDDLKDPNAYKAKHKEYPFHSSTQRKKRRRKEFVVKDTTLEHINYKKKVNLSTTPNKDIL